MTTNGYGAMKWAPQMHRSATRTIGVTWQRGWKIDRLSQLRPADLEVQGTRDCSREPREAVPQIQDERMATAQDISRGRVFETAHRLDALFEVLMVALQAIVHLFGVTMLNHG